MVIYEVNITIDPQIKNIFLPWLYSHAEEMILFDGFSKYYLFENNELENVYTIHYFVDNINSINNYLNNNAHEMRQKGKDKFDGSLSIKRRILSKVNV